MVCPTPDGRTMDQEDERPLLPSGRPRAVLRIFRAELTRKFAAVGSSAPFVVVEWSGPDGTKVEVARTSPHRRGCRSPVWNYEGPGQPERRRYGGGSSGTLEFRVFGESIGAWARGSPTFCGAVSLPLDDLLGESGEDMSASSPRQGCQAHAGPVLDLQLQKRNEITGTITVQALLLYQAFAPSVEWLEEPLAGPCLSTLSPIQSSSLGEMFGRQRSHDGPAAEPRSPGHSPRAAKHSGSDDSMNAAPMGKELSMQTAQTEGGGHYMWYASSARSSMSQLSATQPLRKATRKMTVKPGSCGSRRSKALNPEDLTLIDPGNFQLPVLRLGTSGGTAPFFQLALRDEHGGRSPDYFIGKDLMRAEGEVTFYEQVRAITASASQTHLHNSGLAPLLSYMLEYAGVVECEAPGEVEPVQMLVMRNLRDACKCLRMLDVKIGERTADAGWQGKSCLSAFKQGLLDGLTTSQSEGFRVEGFDGPPAAFTTMDPLIDVSGLPVFTDKDKKKARRFMLQRMPASEIVMHLADVHQEPAEPSEGSPCWAPTELAEIALHEMCRRLAGLSVACRRAPVPQKWVGSSVALGFEVGHCPLREVPEAELRRSVRVNIFDWGRSELNTLERHAELDEAARQDRAAFWRYYVGGVDRLAWEVARCYRHRFGCANGWRSARVAVYDFDSMTENDFIGQVTLPLQLTPSGEEVTVALADLKGRPVRTFFGPQATVTYSVGWRSFPAGSRLQGAWRVSILKAAALPGRDRWQGKSTSDPFAVLTSTSQDGRFQFRQQTSVIERDLNPEWNETFEVPVAATPAALHRAFGDTAPGLGAAPLGTLLPPDDATDAAVDGAVQAWVARLDEAAMNLSGGSAEVAAEGFVSRPFVQRRPPRASHPDVGHDQMEGLLDVERGRPPRPPLWLTAL
uniref:C2 domain-containing protein n=1 Tax=Alexandrium monilatum TaxID=311494 RepID=A0A7S4SL66_9DINO